MKEFSLPVIILLLLGWPNITYEQNTAALTPSTSNTNNSISSTNTSPSFSSNHGGNEKFDPRGPKVRCDYLPLDFLECERLVDHNGNATAKEKAGHGCVKVSNHLLGD